VSAPMTREQIDAREGERFHYWDCDRLRTHDYGLQNGVCDCSAEKDYAQLIAAARYGLDLRDAILDLADNSWKGLVSESSIRKTIDGVK